MEENRKSSIEKSNRHYTFKIDNNRDKNRSTDFGILADLLLH